MKEAEINAAARPSDNVSEPPAGPENRRTGFRFN